MRALAALLHSAHQRVPATIRQKVTDDLTFLALTMFGRVGVPLNNGFISKFCNPAARRGYVKGKHLEGQEIERRVSS